MASGQPFFTVHRSIATLTWLIFQESIGLTLILFATSVHLPYSTGQALHETQGNQSIFPLDSEYRKQSLINSISPSTYLLLLCDDTLALMCDITLMFLAHWIFVSNFSDPLSIVHPGTKSLATADLCFKPTDIFFGGQTRAYSTFRSMKGCSGTSCGLFCPGGTEAGTYSCKLEARKLSYPVPSY